MRFFDIWQHTRALLVSSDFRQRFQARYYRRMGASEVVLIGDDAMIIFLSLPLSIHC